MTPPPKYSHAWWLEQPPRPLAETVRLFEEKRDSLSPAVRGSLEKRLPSLEEAEEIDRSTRELWERVR